MAGNYVASIETIFGVFDRFSKNLKMLIFSIERKLNSLSKSTICTFTVFESCDFIEATIKDFNTVVSLENEARDIIQGNTNK